MHLPFVMIDCVCDSVFICITCVWEEIEDVLHGFQEDGGCTSKLVNGLGEDGGCTSKLVNG